MMVSQPLRIKKKFRIESLENWVLRQGESIKMFSDKLIKYDENEILLKESEEV